MKRLATLLLLVGVMFGLAAQPLQATAPAMAAMDMATMSQADMAAMPDCMASMEKDVTHDPCKCGMSGCLAMLAAGAPLMLVDGPRSLATAAASERLERMGLAAPLRGRSTAPEPEPPSILA